jgi:hypothetical protein
MLDKSFVKQVDDKRTRFKQKKKRSANRTRRLGDHLLVQKPVSERRAATCDARYFL